jgi:hypothetical protein
MKHMTLKQERKARKEIRELSIILVDVQRRLFDIELCRTAAALNVAANKMGFELADLVSARTK